MYNFFNIKIYESAYDEPNLRNVIQSVPVGFFNHSKALAQPVNVFNFDSFAPKSLVLPLLLDGQFPVFRFFVRDLAAGMHFLNANVS